jgi:hypothetical protein
MHVREASHERAYVRDIVQRDSTFRKAAPLPASGKIMKRVMLVHLGTCDKIQLHATDGVSNFSLIMKSELACETLRHVTKDETRQAVHFTAPNKKRTLTATNTHRARTA